MEENVLKLFLITIIIDIILLFILFKEKLNCYDFYLILLIIFNHILFYIGIYTDYDYLIIYCHVSIYILLFLSLFCKNKSLILLFICFCVLIKILWSTNKLCLILALKKKKKIPKNYIGKYINFLVTTVLIILLIKYFYDYISIKYIDLWSKYK